MIQSNAQPVINYINTHINLLLLLSRFNKPGPLDIINTFLKLSTQSDNGRYNILKVKFTFCNSDKQHKKVNKHINKKQKYV